MFSSWTGVSCDNCMKSNFTGKRYKCLICYDFDLCSECYDQSQALLGSSNSSTQEAGGALTTNSTNLNSDNKTASKSTASKSSKSNQITGLAKSQQPAVTPSFATNTLSSQQGHLNTHAMQCILTRSDYELFYGLGNAICDFNISKFND